MWKFGADFFVATPVVGDPNITLESVTDTFGQILEWGFGGEAVATTAMRTGLHRAAEGVGARTDVVEGIYTEGSAASVLFSTSVFATTQPAVEGGPLWQRSWNAHGGVVRWLAAPGEEPSLLGVATIVLENALGVAGSNYGFVWSEW